MRYIFWIFLILLIIFRYLTTRPNFSENDKVRISKKVTSEPLIFENSQRLILYNLKVYLPRYPEISYGDKVVVEGTVAGGILKNPRLIEVYPAEGIFYKLRTKLIEKYNKFLPLPHSALMGGVTIGAKSGIPSEFWENLKVSGTAHVVVASGMNVTLVAGFVMSLLVLVLERRKAIPLTLLTIWVYSLVSGFDAPIIRAAIMGSVAFSAQELGRLYDAQRALILSAFFMLVINPLWISDLGFIMSFVATSTLMLFESKISSFLRFVPRIFREGLATSLAAQIGVAPIIYVTFGQFNLLSPVINALVLWTIAPITIIGILGGLIGLVLEPLGRFIILLAYPLTSWFIYIVQLFS